ncbi:unnamed protein product [Brassica napus]|uniref:(rape) hypothetical protein n=1 Tax=Brassica napus TaxID=3708 RepID=A0A816SJ87_BRANA|nr:unnamed protein product [Brassica napus]
MIFSGHFNNIKCYSCFGISNCRGFISNYEGARETF